MRCCNEVIRYSHGTTLRQRSVRTGIDKIRTCRDSITPHVFTTSTDVDAATTQLEVS